MNESRAAAVPSWVRAVLVVGLLYLFLAGVGLLSEGIEALGEDAQAALFSRVSNPLAGLFVGILATVLVQSSSVTTSTIVGLVATGVVGVGDAVPMIMGANIGTSVTNSLASVGSIRRPIEFKRAVGAATVHDFFNVLAVIVLLPVELATGFLASSADAISTVLVGQDGTKFKSPIKEAVKAPVNFVAENIESLGVAGTAFGVILIVLGLVGIFVALGYITSNMKALVADQFEARINEVLSSGGGAIAILIGIVATVAVQSSSITTSVLVPIAAAGIIRLESVYPITLGANVGTTVTALLASLATDRPEALTIAIVHVLFNVVGIAIFYGIPVFRKIPVSLASGFAEMVSKDRRLLPTYIIGSFVVLPLVGVVVFG